MLKKQFFADYLQKEHSIMFKRLLGEGTYDSFDMRCMVTGQFGVGKTTLVKLLTGDDIPQGRHPTDGISLLEGRCGLDVRTRSWVRLNPGKNKSLFNCFINFVFVFASSGMSTGGKSEVLTETAIQTLHVIKFCVSLLDCSLQKNYLYSFHVECGQFKSRYLYNNFKLTHRDDTELGFTYCYFDFSIFSIYALKAFIMNTE